MISYSDRWVKHGLVTTCLRIPGTAGAGFLVRVGISLYRFYPSGAEDEIGTFDIAPPGRYVRGCAAVCPEPASRSRHAQRGWVRR